MQRNLAELVAIPIPRLALIPWRIAASDIRMHPGKGNLKSLAWASRISAAFPDGVQWEAHALLMDGKEMHATLHVLGNVHQPVIRPGEMPVKHADIEGGLERIGRPDRRHCIEQPHEVDLVGNLARNLTAGCPVAG
ncbi:hypothetical protein D3C72_871660 [compost metagenome]